MGMITCGDAVGILRPILGGDFMEEGLSICIKSDKIIHVGPLVLGQKPREKTSRARHVVFI
jgi:hypothetical protein